MIIAAKNYQYRNGFTLLEITMVLALIGLATAAAIPAYQVFYKNYVLEIVTTTTVHNLRNAQIRSEAMQEDSTWGVYIHNSSVTLFKGASYATRETRTDETTAIPGIITVSTPTEIIFSKSLGSPSTAAIIEFSTPTHTTHVQINTKGAISYY